MLLIASEQVFSTNVLQCGEGGKKMDYTVVVRKAPDGFYIASCPLIPEARAEGKTYEEALVNIREVIELCLEYRHERGEETPLEAEVRQQQLKQALIEGYQARRAEDGETDEEWEGSTLEAWREQRWLFPSLDCLVS